MVFGIWVAAATMTSEREVVPTGRNSQLHRHVSQGHGLRSFLVFNEAGEVFIILIIVIYILYSLNSYSSLHTADGKPTLVVGSKT